MGYIFGCQFIHLRGRQIIPLRWFALQEDREGFLHSHQTNAITYLMRMFIPIPTSLLRIATITLIKPITVAQLVPTAVVERMIETLMHLVALIIVVRSLQNRPVWAILWIAILMVLFAGFVRIASKSKDYTLQLNAWLKTRV